MQKKVTNYITISIFLTSFSTLLPIAKENVDCSNIKKSYERARLFLNAENKYSNEENGVGILQSIVQKCKEDTPNRDNAAFARTVYALANAHEKGRGTNKNHRTACEYYREVLRNAASLPDEDKNNIANDARLRLGDGIYWGWCEEDQKQNWPKALPFYQEILATEEQRIKDKEKNSWITNLAYYFKIITEPGKTHPNTLAWAKGRMADMYREGKGLKQDYVKSLALFQEIENDDQNISDKSIVAWAKYWKAHAYQHGTGVEQDSQKALTVFTDIVSNYKSHDPIAVEYAQKQIDEIESVK